MKYVPAIDIDRRYEIAQLQGRYNIGLSICPECETELSHHFFEHIKGVYIKNELVTFYIVECPECGEKWYCHTRGYSYPIFVDAVEEGRNIHIRPKEVAS